ncbi:hypothetical protein E1211_19520 [Micromonospora sp. 15K316]|uniref:hypothetical protein n=1 Tax=Micromonospora sp. 15K316 TaxID=2530376 RepID=UPI001046F0F0|nr:hypothetical protein [Micromonospora sp. 15K316]TDC33248.1 hypothetical protein E1211_19520 [Micromonospora sp. 15K316]
MSGAVQTGYAPPTGPDAAVPGRRRWLLVATVAWALLLALLAWTSVRDDPPTVREQRTLFEAGPLVDRAVGELAAAAGAAVLELTPPQVERGCRISPLAEGATLSRGVAVAATEGGERQLLEGIADRLPPEWRAGVRMTPDGLRLRADAGEFVAVAGRPAGERRFQLTVDTGCRPIGAGYPRSGNAATPGAEATALTDALRALGLPAEAAPELVTARCPGGGVTRTARSAADLGPQPQVAALAPLATGGPLLETAEVYAYRTGRSTVVLDTTGDAPHLAATTACA